MLKKILLFLISANFAYTYITHGWLKFDPEGFWSTAFVKTWGYGLPFMYFIGFVEFACGILIVIPRLNKYGALGLSIIMIGAFLTRTFFGASMDDLIYIGFNAVTLFYLALVYGINEDLVIISKGKINLQ